MQLRPRASADTATASPAPSGTKRGVRRIRSPSIAGPARTRLPQKVKKVEPSGGLLNSPPLDCGGRIRPSANAVATFAP
ncbi:hypothetical protein NDU88_001207 [Pleurodeles waltl]|uniref:Uncharacterized protein n=1 Tax=Pleurodeles waltl TaxID=8319 RepID=A0AAV7TJF8_PLEWA|nr:hypothetical protein NDU88_001207 [Pleurodeles waltl]